MASCGHRSYNLLQSVTVSGALKVPGISNLRNHVRKPYARVTTALLPRNAGLNRDRLNYFFIVISSSFMDRVILCRSNSKRLLGEKNVSYYPSEKEYIYLTLLTFLSFVSTT